MKHLYVNLLWGILVNALIISFGFAKPTTITSCDREVVFKQPPKRAVSHDSNLTTMMFALELQNKMAGYSGITGWHKMTDTFKKQTKGLPQIAPKSPTIEQLLAVKADFLFAGWNYGMTPGGQLTPHTLKPFGINVYELTESCIHITSKQPAAFKDVYNDIRNLGKIFAVQDRAESLISGLKRDLQALENTLGNIKNPLKVFVYDSGKDTPFTAGLYAMPNAMIKAAGGTNILHDINSSWATTNWELVVERNPEFIVIVDYGKTTAADKINFLLKNPALRSVDAIINKRFVVITYDEATPGIKNVTATMKLAKAFHPHKFQ